MKDAGLAKAFAAALPFLADTFNHPEGKCIFICHALDKAAILNRRSGGHRARAEALIVARLGKCQTMSDWLECHDDLYMEVRADRFYNNGRKVQAHRKAWLEALVKEFS